MALLDLSRHTDEGPDRVGRERGERPTRASPAYGDALRTNEYFLVVRGLELARTAMTMRVRGRKLSATDGPFAETKEGLGGSIVIDIGSRLDSPGRPPVHGRADAAVGCPGDLLHHRGRRWRETLRRPSCYRARLRGPGRGGARA